MKELGYNYNNIDETKPSNYELFQTKVIEELIFIKKEIYNLLYNKKFSKIYIELRNEMKLFIKNNQVLFNKLSNYIKLNDMNDRDQFNLSEIEDLISLNNNTIIKLKNTFLFTYTCISIIRDLDIFFISIPEKNQGQINQGIMVVLSCLKSIIILANEDIRGLFNNNTKNHYIYSFDELLEQLNKYDIST